MSCCTTTAGGRRRTAMLVCSDCPHRGQAVPPTPQRHADPSGLVDVCTLAAAQPCRPGACSPNTAPGQLVTMTVCGRPTLAVTCPLGLHPDHSGIVRRLGMRWIGLPEPTRWPHRRWAAWLTGKPVITTEPEGCGCILVLKRLSLELSPWREAATFDAFGRGGPPWEASTLEEATAWLTARARQTASTARRWARRPATP